MKEEEMLKRLKEFAKYIDNMESGKEKGKLAKYFTGYVETFKKYQFEKARRSYNERN